MIALCKLVSIGMCCILFANPAVLAQDSLKVKTLPAVTVTGATMHVPKKLWKSFATYFTGAYNSRFFKMNRDYLAKFILHDQESRALFTRQGTLVYAISYGYEKNLPKEIRDQVKSSYYDYDITRAIRVSQGDRIIWIINLETPGQLIIVQIEDGDMQQVQQLNKT